MLCITGCTSKKYEWVKINPDKLHLAKTAKPYQEDVKQINIYVNAKQKAETIIYYGDTDTFLKDNQTNNRNPISVKNTVKKFNRNSNRRLAVKGQVSAPIKSLNTKTSKVLKEKNTAQIDEELAMSKLNSALIIPQKKSQKLSTETIKNKAVKQETSNTSKQNTTSETKVNTNKNPDTLLQTQTSKTTDVEVSDINSNEDSVKKYQDDGINHPDKQDDKRNNYMWVGLVLIIIGLILGLVFGGLAYLISVVGLVFLLIGYFYKS
ncbi:hypothetical protein [Pedobacter glucosidilyticus]|uniref:hypothetical protein n=1 Tax=Pedobacter glucosidilyticus TaxID=1122941 RepID=UPI00041D9AE0|nr:hypothetical protein [Pedobacter glucosidilyticus]